MFEQALALERSGRAREAAALYRKLVARNARHDGALFRLGTLLLAEGAVHDATRYLERAAEVRRDPNYLTNLGEAYRREGKLELANTVLALALALAPDLPEAHQNLALAQIQAGALDEARAHLERVVELRPDQANAPVTLAWLLLRAQRPDQAVTWAERAVELEPNLSAAHRALGDALDMLGDKQRAIASYRRTLALCPTDHVSHSNLLVSMLTDPSVDETTLGVEARAWAERHAEPLRAQIRAHDNAKTPERRLRVGYVSPDLRVHPTEHFFPVLLEHHDHAAFEIFVYSSVERPDARTAAYRTALGERFRAIQSLGDVEAAELVRKDAIDVLVDLAVHGPGNRLRVFACKPAPVQLTWLGYPGTTGLTTVDYRISDPYLDPPGSELGAYSETTLSLPRSFWCYDALAPDTAVAPLPAFSHGFVTFGALNSPRKLHAGVLALFARVLRALPDARLLLHVEPHGQKTALETFAAAGVERDRVEFTPRVTRAEYLALHHRIDIGLDTFPFAGGTTTLDAAWMGVPVVTLTGPRTVQRAGHSIATNLGLGELVAHSEDEYVERAVTLARALPRLAELRTGLRARLAASPLGAAPTFARDMEALYRAAWRRYCAEL
jgi:predicted O-linked N-acetylglucosamine transferase (SPINDLY family)